MIDGVVPSGAAAVERRVSREKARVEMEAIWFSDVGKHDGLKLQPTVV